MHTVIPDEQEFLILNSSDVLYFVIYVLYLELAQPYNPKVFHLFLFIHGLCVANRMIDYVLPI